MVAVPLLNVSVMTVHFLRKIFYSYGGCKVYTTPISDEEEETLIFFVTDRHKHTTVGKMIITLKG
jgi:hypothetical protein